jgi:CelD/BcsL family acetyltransferase involved in cellulose biosynthesis
MEALKPVWNRLLSESNSDTITLTWEWLTTWWDVFHPQRELYLLVAGDGREIIGLAPFLRRTVVHFGLLPYRCLEFLASGEDEADEICSPYLDFIIRRGRESEVLEAFLRYLQEHKSDWDEIVLKELSAQSPNPPLIEKLLETQQLSASMPPGQISMHLPLPSDFESVLAGLSHDFRKKLRRDRRITLEHEGELRIIESADRFEEHFEILILLHQESWTSRGEHGVFASELFTRFHRQLARKILPLGWIRLYVLLISGAPVSALLVFHYQGRAYSYLAGRSFKDCPVYRPGMLVHGYAIERAIREGLREYDFLKATPDSYKLHWKGQAREIFQMRLAQAASKETIYNATTSLVDGLRQIKRAAQKNRFTKTSP